MARNSSKHTHALSLRKIEGESLTLPTNGNIYISNSTYDSYCLNLFQKCGLPGLHIILDYLEFVGIVQIKTSFLCSLLDCLNIFRFLKLLIFQLNFDILDIQKSCRTFNATDNHRAGIGGGLTDCLTAVGLNVEVTVWPLNFTSKRRLALVIEVGLTLSAWRLAVMFQISE